MPGKIKRNIGIFVIVLIVLAATAALIIFYPLLNMKPTGTGIVEGTEILSVRNNRNSIFLIPSENGYIVIDAGTNKDKVENALNDLSIDSSDIKYVLLTHSDYDHVGSLPLYNNAEIYMSDDELQMLNGVTRRNILSSNSLPDNIDINSIKLLSDRQELILDGISVMCIKTPGHTTGSMSFLVNSKYLFTGDAVYVKDNSFKIHPFTMDEQKAQKSIELLTEIKSRCTMLFTSHYGYHNPEKMWIFTR